MLLVQAMQLILIDLSLTLLKDFLVDALTEFVGVSHTICLVGHLVEFLFQVFKTIAENGASNV